MKNRYYFIDESGDNEHFLLVVSILDNYSKSSSQINEGEKVIKSSLLVDKFDEFKGFHASPDDFTIRTKFVELLRYITYRSYIIIINKDSNFSKNQEKLYYKLFYYLAKDLLIRNKDKNNIFCFESCSTIKNGPAKKQYTKIVNRINSEYIKDKKAIEGIKFEIEIKGKEEKLLSISDYMGYIILSNYKKDNQPLIKRYYKLLSSKIGMIHDITDNKFYNSKKPYIVK
jgi:hypothetical protein